MNFQLIPPVFTDTALLDIAFRRARTKAQGKEASAAKEIMKMDVVRDVLVSRLDGIIQDFPKERELGVFYGTLLRLTVDYPLYKKSLGAVNWAKEKISAIHKSSRRTTRTVKTVNIAAMYGRVASVLQQIKPNLEYLEQCRMIMRTYPDLKPLPTVCLYGFPNVGKTTLLNKLAGTKAKIADYAFTTTSINSGTLKIDDRAIQVLDVPGTLAREEKMNPIELQAELVVREVADVVVFVLDLTARDTPLEKQLELLKKIDPAKKVMVFGSKSDVVGPAAVRELIPLLGKIPFFHDAGLLKSELILFFMSWEKKEEPSFNENGFETL